MINAKRTLAALALAGAVLTLTPTAQAAEPAPPGAAAQLHGFAHCIFFFIPQPFSHPEDKWHFNKKHCSSLKGTLIGR